MLPQWSQHHLRGTCRPLGKEPECGTSSLTVPSCSWSCRLCCPALSSCGCRLTGNLFADTSTPCLPCLWMLQQYFIKSRSFSRNLLKKTQTNLSLFLWLISVLLNCLEFHCQQAAEPPIPIRDVFSLILPGFLRAVNIPKQRKPFPEQISEGPHRTTARQAGQHLGKPALAGSSPLLLVNCTSS